MLAALAPDPAPTLQPGNRRSRAGHAKVTRDAIALTTPRRRRPAEKAATWRWPSR